jgi:hypothetical protein
MSRALNSVDQMLKDNSAKMPIVDAAHGATWATAEDGEG